ncbi:hypothetical protein L0Y59_00085, partial [Candidatus Uhrbacteria bacterium]|nr:hypothetical protein [Candidatus Uhrbacteria bacterium]
MPIPRASHLIGVLLGVAIPMTALAAFIGPTGQPPDENVPGVIWNRFGNPQSAEFDITGRGRVGADLYLNDAKAIRVDKAGTAVLNVGNWNPTSFPLKFTVWGDIETNPIGAGDGLEGKITAPKYCIGASCITAWPVAGGGGDITGVAVGTGITGGGTSGDVTIGLDTGYTDGRYVKKAGDIMTGTLGVGNGVYGTNDPTVWVGDGQYGLNSSAAVLRMINKVPTTGAFAFRTLNDKGVYTDVVS